jgi:hypothetical protein
MEAEFLGRPCFGSGFRREGIAGGHGIGTRYTRAACPDSGKGETVIWGESTIFSIPQPEPGSK